MLGVREGTIEGIPDGSGVGRALGDSVGSNGGKVGDLLGISVGTWLGGAVGLSVGGKVGFLVENFVGIFEGLPAEDDPEYIVGRVVGVSMVGSSMDRIVGGAVGGGTVARGVAIVYSSAISPSSTLWQKKCK